MNKWNVTILLLDGYGGGDCGGEPRSAGERSSEQGSRVWLLELQGGPFAPVLRCSRFLPRPSSSSSSSDRSIDRARASSFKSCQGSSEGPNFRSWWVFSSSSSWCFFRFEFRDLIPREMKARKWTQFLTWSSDPSARGILVWLSSIGFEGNLEVIGRFSSCLDSMARRIVQACLMTSRIVSTWISVALIVDWEAAVCRAGTRSSSRLHPYAWSYQAYTVRPFIHDLKCLLKVVLPLLKSWSDPVGTDVKFRCQCLWT